MAVCWARYCGSLLKNIHFRVILTSVIHSSYCCLFGTLSHRCLSVVFGVQNFLSTHSTDSFLVRTALTVVWSMLMNWASADPAGCKTRLAVRVKPGFLGSKDLVFIELSPTTLCCIPCSVLPGVRCDHFTELRLALVTNHFPLCMFQADTYRQRLGKTE